MTVKKFEQLVKNKKKDDYVILRAYWDYDAGREFANLEDDLVKIEKFIWVHRRKAWHFINYQWNNFTPNVPTCVIK